MPIIESAKKQMRQNAKAKARNDRSRSQFRDVRVNFERLIKEEDSKAATAELPKLYSMIDKLAKKNLIHENNAARKKSRYSRMLKEISSAKKKA